MEILQEIRDILQDRLKRSGTAFYSCSNTLKKGKYLIVGLNPGGDVDGSDATIEDSLSSFLDEDYNAYYQDDWKSNRLQKNIKALFDHLGVELRDVCATNLIYERSKNEVGANTGDIMLYKQILDKVVRLVSPDCIVTFGKKPYDILSELLKTSESSVFNSGHKNWTIRLSESNHDGRMIKLLGLPHLSRYVLYGRKEQLDWIKSNIS